MNSRMRFALGIVVILAVAMLGFSPQAQAQTITMKYNQEVGKTLNYKSTAEVNQEVDAMGQLITVDVDTEGGVLYKVGKVEGDKLTHEISYTSLEVSVVSSVAGEVPTPTDDVLNQPLVLITDLNGGSPDPSNLSDLPTLGEDQPAALGLMGLILEIAKDPVKVNDKWTSDQTLTIELPNGTAEVTGTIEYTYAGMEQRLGYNCMKITGKGTTSTSATGSMQGMDTETIEESESEIVAYFAHEEGFFVEMEVNSTSDSTIDIISAGVSLTATGTSKGKYVLDEEK
ncbi:MAG: hypothetical protein GY863_18570 [bacterium]|nr:hypothetical protein [bacterium]